MRCSNPYCNRGIGLLAHRRGWFSRRRIVRGIAAMLSWRLCQAGHTEIRVALLATDWNPQQTLIPAIIHIKAR